MLFCTRDQITDLLLANYVAACEEQNPGLVERTIEAVSGGSRPCFPTAIRSRGRRCRISSDTSPRSSAPTGRWKRHLARRLGSH